MTDTGVAALAVALQRNRAAFDAHEALVALVVRQMQRGGRTAFTGLGLRAAVPGTEGEGPRWVLAKPDVFSIRHTKVAAYLAPAVHEIRVRRADLLGELRATPRSLAKRGAYMAMGSECWYVLGRDAQGREIGDASEVPADFGVMQALPDAAGLPFATWLVLARSVPAAAEADTQARL